LRGLFSAAEFDDGALLLFAENVESSHAALALGLSSGVKPKF